MSLKKKGQKEATKKKYPKVPKAQVHLYAAFNNTFATITDFTGNVLTSPVTAGLLGFSGCKKSTPHAIRLVIQTVLHKAHTMFSTKEIEVFVSGPGAARDMVSFFQNENISVTSIRDVTKVPHNGVKQRRKRRT